MVNGLNERLPKRRLVYSQHRHMGFKAKCHRQLHMGTATAACAQWRADIGSTGICMMLGNCNGVTFGGIVRTAITV
jgi:hypothetical protein